MSVIDVDAKIANKINIPVPALNNKEKDGAGSATQEAAVAKAEAAETLTVVAQHPLADLFGKYGGGYWDEVFAALEQDRLDRQNAQEEQEDTAASQE